MHLSHWWPRVTCLSSHHTHPPHHTLHSLLISPTRFCLCVDVFSCDIYVCVVYVYVLCVICVRFCYVYNICMCVCLCVFCVQYVCLCVLCYVYVLCVIFIVGVRVYVLCYVYVLSSLRQRGTCAGWVPMTVIWRSTALGVLLLIISSLLAYAGISPFPDSFKFQISR